LELPDATSLHACRREYNRRVSEVVQATWMEQQNGDAAAGDTAADTAHKDHKEKAEDEGSGNPEPHASLHREEKAVKKEEGLASVKEEEGPASVEKEENSVSLKKVEK
jgi:hypothetical protein